MSRILICGTRLAKATPLIEAIYDELVLVPGDVVIHGAAPGVDTEAGRLARERGADVEEYPADWQRHGMAAGPRRNQRMLDEGKPERCYALPDENSKGTLDMIERARKRLGDANVIVRPCYFTESGVFPVKDATGYPLGVDCFVRVVAPSKMMPGRVAEFRGLVKAVRFDMHGAIVEIREWYGRFTGKNRVARPEHCTVERGPKEMRQLEVNRAARRHAQPQAQPARAVRRK